MDKETLLEFRKFWGNENAKQRFTSQLSYLTDEENNLYNALIDNKYAENIRLEQERVPLWWLKEYLHQRSVSE